MMNISDPIQDFASLMRRGEAEFNLDEAALLLARTEYSDLNLPDQLRRLDALALRLDCDPRRPALENIESMNEILFEQEQFRGNEEEYDDPRNSYLNDVLDRKLGIPISLSLIYIEVARRRNLPAMGVGFPGHFLVKYRADFEEILVDPYNRGRRLTRQDCKELLKAQFGEEAQLKQEYFVASTKKQILARMLNNLKGSYLRRNNYTRTLTLIQLALLAEPESSQQIHDRGMIYFLMRRYEEARADFNAYLRLTPRDDPQAAEVAQLLHRIRGMMN
jgi:regulator of sirC expression with transglutaminase-like and TPR domain